MELDKNSGPAQIDLDPLDLDLVRKLMELLYVVPMGYTFTDKMSWGMPWVTIGDPATAKTSLTKQVVQRFRHSDGTPHQAYVMEPGALGENAFGVVPVPQKIRIGETEPVVMTAPPPEALVRRFSGGRAGIIVFDEMSTAAGRVMDALLSGIQYAKIGDWQGPANVRRCGAMNPWHQTHGGKKFNAAVMNRFVSIPVPAPKVESWLNYMGTLGSTTPPDIDWIDVDEEEARILEKWSEVWSDTLTLWGGFVAECGEFFHKMPAKGADPQPWPSSRSYEGVMRVWTTCVIRNEREEVRNAAVRGLIGPSAFRAFENFRITYDLPKIDDYLAHRVEFVHSEDRRDRTMAFFEGIVARMNNLSEDSRAQHADRVIDLLLAVGEADADIIITPTRRLQPMLRPASNPKAGKLIRQIQPIYAATSSLRS